MHSTLTNPVETMNSPSRIDKPFPVLVSQGRQKILITITTAHAINVILLILHLTIAQVWVSFVILHL